MSWTINFTGINMMDYIPRALGENKNMSLNTIALGLSSDEIGRVTMGYPIKMGYGLYHDPFTMITRGYHD